MTIQLDVKKVERYEEVLNEAVDKALNNFFGCTATNIIYKYLENSYSIKKNEIARKFGSFREAMQEYLNSGAAVVENEIQESFHSDINVSNSNETRIASFVTAQKH
ncbi:MAG: hypothetical protein ACLFU9_02830 [Candidatus Bathyarchaeia archaeon]